MEDKAGFVTRLSEAFAVSDPKRYKRLAEHPVRYAAEERPRGVVEYITDGSTSVNVTGNSLYAIARAFLRAFV